MLMRFTVRPSGLGREPNLKIASRNDGRKQAAAEAIECPEQCAITPFLRPAFAINLAGSITLIPVWL